MADRKIKNIKIRPVTKQDRNHITNTLFPENVDNDSLDSISWVDRLSTIDPDSLKRSIAQILNSDLDYIPDNVVQCVHQTLSSSSQSMKTVTLNDLLSSTDCIFRIAPSPSGYLHIGHIVPLLLNLLLTQVCRNGSHNSDTIIRIDDTNPDEDDYSSDILNTLSMFLQKDVMNNYTVTRSSAQINYVIKLIDNSIWRKDDKFYVDLSDQDTIRKDRADRKDSIYRDQDADTNIDLWQKLRNGEIKGVVRAKIDMKSDNGNLRDPVMIRPVDNMINDAVDVGHKLMPTYDLICPILDSIDAQRNNKVLVALRDGNYYDRKDQYFWIQSALGLTPTVLLTFSRVNFDGVVLSKRKIKQMIKDGIVDSWDDPRLMTIDGIFNRGMTIDGLLNFYWISGNLSVGNRITSQDVKTLFAANNKMLSRKNIFIMDRKDVKFVPSDNDRDSYYRVNIDSCHNMNIDRVSTVYALRHKIITCNLKNINALIDTYNNRDDIVNRLDNGTDLIGSLDRDKFKLCTDLTKGDIIKINNFKDLPDDPNFGGYYIIRNRTDDTIDVMYID